MKRRVWLLNLCVGIAGAVSAVFLHVETFRPLATMLAVQALLPMVSFGLLIRGDEPLPSPGERVRRSGSWLGAHWFEVEGCPGRRSWTRDAGRTRELRAFTEDGALAGGFSRTIVPTPDGRSTVVLEALGHALGSWMLAWFVFWMGPALYALVGLVPTVEAIPMDVLGPSLGGFLATAFWLGSVYGILAVMALTIGRPPLYPRP